MTSFVEDLTERMSSRRATAAHVVLAAAISTWPSFEDGAQRLLSGVAGALECQAGIVWLPRKHELVARTVWQDQTAGATLLDPVERGARLRRGSGLAWRAHARCELAHAPSAVAIPAVSGNEVLALVELRSAEPLELSERLTRSLTEIGRELGEFLDERRDQLDIPLLTPRELEVLALASQGWQ